MLNAALDRIADRFGDGAVATGACAVVRRKQANPDGD